MCTGTLYIPYAEIEEPFAAWVDLKAGRSRIDFYGGSFYSFDESTWALNHLSIFSKNTFSMLYTTLCWFAFKLLLRIFGWLNLKKGVSKTYQLGDRNDYGVMRKIVPMTTEELTNQLTCFEVNGTQDNKITAQSMLPDISRFSVSS